MSRWRLRRNTFNNWLIKGIGYKNIMEVLNMNNITLMNNDQRIFCGLYESILYNSDTDYYLAQYLAEDNLDGIDLKMLKLIMILMSLNKLQVKHALTHLKMSYIHMT